MLTVNNSRLLVEVVLAQVSSAVALGVVHHVGQNGGGRRGNQNSGIDTGALVQQVHLRLSLSNCLYGATVIGINALSLMVPRH